MHSLTDEDMALLIYRTLCILQTYISQYVFNIFLAVSSCGTFMVMTRLYLRFRREDEGIAYEPGKYDLKPRNARHVILTLLMFILPEAAVEMFDIEHVKAGDTVTSDEDLHFKMHHLETDDGKQWLVAFTSQDEFEKGESASTISHFIDVILKGCRDMEEAGIIINPWDKPFFLTTELIGMILDADKPDNHIYLEVGA